MTMAWHDVYKDFNSLTKKEQLELFRAVQQDLFPEPKSYISKMIGEVRETRFSKGLERVLNMFLSSCQKVNFNTVNTIREIA